MVAPNPAFDGEQQVWAKYMASELVEIRRQIGFLRQDQDALYQQSGSTGNNLIQRVQDIAAAQTALAAAQAALPVTQAFYVRRDGFGLVSPLTVDINFSVPAGKTRGVFTLAANIAALDTSSGGVAVAEATGLFQGPGFTQSSPSVPAAKDAGASRVNNIINPYLVFAQNNLVAGQVILASVRATASNNQAFQPQAGNYATLSVTAIFS